MSGNDGLGLGGVGSGRKNVILQRFVVCSIIQTRNLSIFILQHSNVFRTR